jgi:hypothetical protein
MDRCFERYRKINQMRSVVIHDAIDIENDLTAMLLHFLVHTDYRRHDILRAFVFEAEFCSFMHMRKMLSLIFDLFPDSIPCLSEADAKELRRDLNQLILGRDMFAHGRIIIDGRTEKVFIKYYREKPTEREITEETLTEFKESVQKIDDKIQILNEYFRDNEFTEELSIRD